MDILPSRDLIMDEYGNFYVAVKVSDKQITLVNAFMHISFRRRLMLNDEFSKEFEKYKGKYFGQPAMDTLQYKIKAIREGKKPGNIYPMKDVIEHYGDKNVFYISLYEGRVKKRA